MHGSFSSSHPRILFCPYLTTFPTIGSSRQGVSGCSSDSFMVLVVACCGCVQCCMVYAFVRSVMPSGTQASKLIELLQLWTRSHRVPSRAEQPQNKRKIAETFSFAAERAFRFPNCVVTLNAVKSESFFLYVKSCRTRFSR